MVAKPGRCSIEREPVSLAPRVAQREKARLGGAGATSVGRNELHRALKFGRRDPGILRRYVLISPVLDAVTRELLPVARPVAAKSAIAVIDQHWPRRLGRSINGIGGPISGCFLHDTSNIGAERRLGIADPARAVLPWQSLFPSPTSQESEASMRRAAWEGEGASPLALRPPTSGALLLPQLLHATIVIIGDRRRQRHGSQSSPRILK